MPEDRGLAGAVDAAQSILASAGAAEARRIEEAQALTCESLARAMARLSPSLAAGSLRNGAGVAIFGGAGSPMTQGLAMGLSGPVVPADLDLLEGFLSRGLHARQVELCPYADPSLNELLAGRAYRVHEWQLVWVRTVDDEPPLAVAGLEVRRALPEDIEPYLHAVLAGFLESEAVPSDAKDLLRPTAQAEGFELYVACAEGEVIGGACLSWANGVAFVNGSGVRPGYRRRGAQGALIRARLRRARDLGCDLAASCTLPGTSSRRNMERAGFRVAYPKLVMLRA